MKHYLVPGRHNGYRAKLLRAQASGVTALAVVLLFLGALGVQSVLSTSASPQVAAVVASSLVDLANGDRASQGLPALEVSPLLQEAAQLKANDMAAGEYFAHVSPTGKDPWYWFAQAGYSFAYAGENLAVYFTDSDAVNTAWMNSPEHRANLLDAHYTEIGIATASGMYQGQQTVFVVEEFGTPAAADVAEAAPQTTQVAPSTAAAPAVEPLPATSQPAVAGAQAAVTTAPASVTTNPKSKSAAISSTPSVAPKPVEVLQESATGIAVQNPNVVPRSGETAGSTRLMVSPVSFFFSLATSPMTLLLYLYEMIAVAIVTAIGFELTLEIEKRHQRHLVRGFSMLALMIVLLGVGHFYLIGQVLIA